MEIDQLNLMVNNIIVLNLKARIIKTQQKNLHEILLVQNLIMRDVRIAKELMEDIVKRIQLKWSII